MGNFYVNFTCRGPKLGAVMAALADREAFVVSAGKATLITERSTSGQDTKAIEAFAATLSEKLGTAVLAVLNHDDDVLMIWLAREGRIVDRYNSDPEFFGSENAGGKGGDVDVITKAFGVTKSEPLRGVLHDDDNADGGYMFASDRHRDMCTAMGLPSAAVGFGFDVVARGDLPEELEPEDIVKVR